MGLPHIEDCIAKEPSQKPSQTVELGATDQSLSPQIRQISLHWISFCGGTSKTKCMLPLYLIYQCYKTASVVWLPRQTRTCWTEHGKKLSTALTLFVPPIGHMLKCAKLTTVTQILWVPLSYTTNCIHLAFSVFFHSDWVKCGRFKRGTLYV
jgi:hypothetical protein